MTLVTYPNTGKSSNLTYNETFSLAGLSPQAQRLIQELLAQPANLNHLLAQYNTDRPAFWGLIQAYAPTLTPADLRLLELLAELFVPDSSLQITVSGCWGGDCPTPS